MKYATFAEVERLLLTAIGLPGRSIKEVAQATGIQANTLYKWKTTSVHLSPEKADRLLLYFMENEPKRLSFAKAALERPV
ncbi:MAG: transposase [Clostridiales bacterium]|nr:transposase [Clostridiales bacterium]